MKVKITYTEQKKQQADKFAAFYYIGECTRYAKRTQREQLYFGYVRQFPDRLFYRCDFRYILIYLSSGLPLFWSDGGVERLPPFTTDINRGHKHDQFRKLSHSLTILACKL